jgi:hypothetical protein
MSRWASTTDYLTQQAKCGRGLPPMALEQSMVLSTDTPLPGGEPPPTNNRDQCMKIAIRMITGIGTPRNHRSNERMLFSLN